MYPLKLTPAFKDYLWGGTRLRDDYGKKCDFDKVAESWELSCHKDGNSVIANGESAGMTLSDYIVKEGKSILGTNCERFENFPVLIKLIDAKDNLSVQVHPDNEYAMRVEGEYGKTEMWYVVDCDEGATLLYGFKNNVTKEEFAERIKNNTLLEITNAVPVKKGDVFFIESGTLHAIGKGILIAEIQQNSNTTYRVYDYGRVGADGKTRPLHIEKALDVTKLCPAKPYPTVAPMTENGCTKQLLSKCEYFTVYKLNIDDSADFNADNTSFECLLNLEGSIKLVCGDNEISLEKGETAFIPAGCGKYTIMGKCEAILTRID
ncbi:MAG: class I mannose-6-phosphate isomerase [Oscillospiraceae bacterium]|nr:class I mannose-6-phosphate isomerase [Oscillospiraceae bacterium]